MITETQKRTSAIKHLSASVWTRIMLELPVLTNNTSVLTLFRHGPCDASETVIWRPHRIANFQVEPGDLLLLHLISKIQISIPFEIMAALEGGLLKSLPTSCLL